MQSLSPRERYHFEIHVILPKFFHGYSCLHLGLVWRNFRVFGSFIFDNTLLFLKTHKGVTKIYKFKEG